MEHNIVFSDIRESDKVAIVLSEFEHDDNLTNLVRYSFTKFTNKDSFIQNCKDICYNEQAKKILYGLQENFKTFTVADDFDQKGKVIQKHINQVVAATLKNQNITVYPDGSVTNKDFYRVTQDKNYWSDAEAIEGDFNSITRVLVATRRIKNCYKVKFDFQYWQQEYIDHFKKVLKYWSIELVDKIDKHTIVLTDRVIDREFISEFPYMEKPIIISLADYSTNYTDKDYILELCKRKVHVIPSYFVNIGSTIIAEGLAMGTRNVKDSFQLMQLIDDKIEKFWNFADNKHMNFYEVCKEVIDNYFFDKPNKFRNTPVGVGAMTLKV